MDKLSEFQHLVSDRGSNVFLKTHDIETRLVELVKLIEISEEEEQKRAEIQQVIEKVLERSFPDVEVHPLFRLPVASVFLTAILIFMLTSRAIVQSRIIEKPRPKLWPTL